MTFHERITKASSLAFLRTIAYDADSFVIASPVNMK